MFPLRDSVPSRTTPVVTWSIIGLNSLVFLYELHLPPPALERFVYLFGLVPARYSHPAWATWMGIPADSYWPFLTSMFLHAGWGHFLGNMWTLWIFGDNVEDRMGPARFALFYVAMGLVAGIVQWTIHPTSTVPTVGASGAIAGVLGAYMFLFPHARVIVLVPLLFWPFFVDLPAATFLLIWFATQILSGTASLLGPEQAGGVAWFAHIGGFTAGLLSHRFFLRPKRHYIRPHSPDEMGIEAAWSRLLHT